jgi:succinate dehydrogenase / fumarate reductase, cytochrome b subunit
MDQRPLSPHLQVYRFGLTMTVSILHRLSGIALSLGLVLGVLSLLQLTQGASAYAQWVSLFATPVGTLLRAGVLLALVYHSITGVRHLIFDLGLALERRTARTSAYVVLISFVVLASVVLGLWIHGGGV